MCRGNLWQHVCGLPLGPRGYNVGGRGEPVKRVVSVSLGSSKRDKKAETELLGERYLIERVSADGDLKRFAAMFRELDGKVDALGIGGADRYIWLGDRRYEFKQIARLVSGAVRTPVVDGSGLKNTLEREVIRRVQEQGIVNFAASRALVVSAIDRFGLAQTLAEYSREIVYGDALFAVGLPLPIKSYKTLKMIGSLALPIVTHLPFRWVYPVGEKQNVRKPRHGKWFEWADVIAGDWNYILRYMPDALPGKTIITQSVRKENLDFFRKAKIARLITTTPVIEGETFATNVWEAVLVAYLGRRPEELTPAAYLDTLGKLDWKLNVVEF